MIKLVFMAWMLSGHQCPVGKWFTNKAVAFNAAEISRDRGVMPTILHSTGNPNGFVHSMPVIAGKVALVENADDEHNRQSLLDAGFFRPGKVIKPFVLPVIKGLGVTGQNHSPVKVFFGGELLPNIFDFVKSADRRVLQSKAETVVFGDGLPKVLDVDINVTPNRSVFALQRLRNYFDGQPWTLGKQGYSVSLAHGSSSFAGVVYRLSSQHYLPSQQSHASQGRPEAIDSPIRRFFSSLRSAPLSAQIAFTFALWLLAGGAFHYGRGDIGDGRFRPLFIIFAGLIGLIPLIWIIQS